MPMAPKKWSDGVGKSGPRSTGHRTTNGLTYQKNPRPIETNIYDADGNHRRTTISYTSYSLPFEVTEYAANAVDVVRRTQTYYDLSAAYINRRNHRSGKWHLWLRRQRGAGTPRPSTCTTRTGAAFTCRRPRSSPCSTTLQIIHSGFIVGRGNLVWVGRFDVNDPDN